MPRDDLVAELRRLRDELDQIPTADQMDEHGAYAYITYYERFGSWADALEEVFGEVPDREWKHISDDALIADLQRLAGDDGAPPTTTDLRDHGEYSRTAYEYRFGSWRDALEAAGFEPPPPQRVPTEELLAELRRLHDELGGRPTTTVVREHGAYSRQTYYNRFESWDDALDAAFETVPTDAVDKRRDDEAGTKAHSDEELLDELRRVADCRRQRRRTVDLGVRRVQRHRRQHDPPALRVVERRRGTGGLRAASGRAHDFGRRAGRRTPSASRRGRTRTDESRDGRAGRVRVGDVQESVWLVDRRAHRNVR
ncbi:MAG: hypothetical protein U5K38_17105 [Woeseiaceae bacterium]|nr:hypothetical protein [Woeseiaceae bacterium]